jgi:hypothetical protein
MAWPRPALLLLDERRQNSAQSQKVELRLNGSPQALLELSVQLWMRRTVFIYQQAKG